MKAKVLLFAILLVFAACGKKQEVLAVVLEKETGTTPTTYTTVPIGSTHMTMPIRGMTIASCVKKNIPIYNEYGDITGCYPADRFTKAEAIDWLDSKEVYIQISGIGSGETQKWSYSVFDYKTCDNHASEYIFPTRLEAEEAAIIKALELL